MLVIVVVGGYLLAALAGAYIGSGKLSGPESANRPHTIYLLMGTLHADFAVPATPHLYNRFPFLRQSSLPLDNPNLRYVTFGWGSKAFYTTAGSYSDITFSAVARAVTGDDAVMRVVGFGDVANLPDTIAIRLTENEFNRLMEFIRKAFVGETPEQMTGESIGQGDAFYAASGHFNIFRPCNQWVNEALTYAGVPIGSWTPTTYSLRQSLAYHAPPAVVQISQP